MQSKTIIQTITFSGLALLVLAWPVLGAQQVSEKRASKGAGSWALGGGTTGVPLNVFIPPRPAP